MANIPIQSMGANVQVVYALYLPCGIWIFDTLEPHRVPVQKMGSSSYWTPDLAVPVDLITAARLRLIKPGDDSGLTEAQWAWIKLIGLTGEST